MSTDDSTWPNARPPVCGDCLQPMIDHAEGCAAVEWQRRRDEARRLLATTTRGGNINTILTEALCKGHEFYYWRCPVKGNTPIVAARFVPAANKED